MDKEIIRKKPIPSPSTRELREIITEYNKAILAAQNTQDDIQQNVFTAEKNDDDHIDLLLHLGATHETITTRTIPVLTAWRDRWVQELQNREEKIEQWVETGVLPKKDLPRAKTIFQSLKSDLGIIPEQPERKLSLEAEVRPDREHDRLQYWYNTRLGEKTRIVEIPEEMHEREYALLINLLRPPRGGLGGGAFVKSRSLNRELTEQFGKKDTYPLVYRINRLRKWLGDDLDNPKIIDQTGERGGTEYRFNARTKLLKIGEEPEGIPPTVPLSPKVTSVPEAPLVLQEVQHEEKKFYRPVTPLEDKDPLIRETIRGYLEQISSFIKPGESRFGRQITNHFRGTSGNLTQVYYQGAVQRGILRRDVLKESNPQLNREDILMMFYDTDHAGRIGQGDIKANQLRTIVREVLAEFERQERAKEKAQE